MDKLHRQDLIASARARVHYAHQGFKEAFLLAVRAGKFPPIGRFANEDDRQQCAIFCELARRYPHPEAFTDETWQSLETQWLSACVAWHRYYDQRTRPNKRYRTMRVLQANPLSGYAAIAVFGGGPEA